MILRQQVGISESDALAHGYSEKEFDFLVRIVQDYLKFRWSFGRKFAFRPPKTVVIGPKEPHFEMLFLHEVGHAVCRHRDFKLDVERLKMEVEAWDKARELAGKYDVYIDEDIVQQELDTYRNWLHQKSRCPECGLTRFQTPDSQYHCPRCSMLNTNKK